MENYVWKYFFFYFLDCILPLKQKNVNTFFEIHFCLQKADGSKKDQCPERVNNKDME